MNRLILLLTFVLIACTEQQPIVQATNTPVPPTGASPTITNVTEPAVPSNMIHVIYDDDGSRDGTAALLFLLSRPQISMDAITISYGEAHPEIYIQHIGRLLDEVGSHDIPLGAGQDKPLAGGTPFPDWLRTLSDRFWDFPLTNGNKTYSIQNTPELMVETISQSSEPVTIFMSGTFTTLAQALRLDPGIREKIVSVYIMGGAIYVPGNITNLIPDSSNKVAEWNIIADPLAAKEVFDSGLDMYLVPLDSTNKVMFHQDDIQPWHRGNKKAQISAELYEAMFNEYGWEQAEIFDLGAAVIMVEPEACEFQSIYLDVIIDEGDNMGQTIVIPDRKPNIKVCLQPNANLIMQVLNETFVGLTKPLGTPSIAPIVGTWTGTALNNGVELQVSITIEHSCQLEQVCGRFDIPTAACSGTLTWVGMDGEFFQFQAGDKAEGCGKGIDYLLPQADGTVLYISRGDYGETKGILQQGP